MRKRTAVFRGKNLLACVLLLVLLTGLTACAGSGTSTASGRETADSATAQTASSQETADSDALSEPGQTDTMELHFLDVGQGLSVFMKSEDACALYDGGDRSHSSFVVSYLKNQGVEKLDYLIASHYDSDHINGVIGAMNAFEIGTIIGPDYVHTSKEYQTFMDTAAKIGKTVEHPEVGAVYPFGSASITVLSPETIVSDSNNNSVTVKVTNGTTSCILTGDAEYQEEADILASGLDLNCDILVLGHHGSASSSSWDFLEKTLPEYGVISCGAGNSYGHPHEETMEKLENMEIEIFRTDLQGTVIACSDGASLSWNTQASTDYSSGDELAEGTAAAAGTKAGSGTDTADGAKAGSGTDTADGAKPDSGSDDADGAKPVSNADAADSETVSYVLNTNTKKFHNPTCRSVDKIKPENYGEFNGSRDQAIAQGYSPCGICNP